MTHVSPTQPRIIFMGTGPFAVPALERLTPSYPVVAIVTQPDRQAGRGRTVGRGTVARLGDEMSIPVLQPHTLRDESAVGELARRKPDLLIVASYGLILPKSVFNLPTRGALNLHPSMLPRHRGPSPVAGAILDGNTTGVSVMEMVSKMDAGPVVAQRKTDIHPSDNTETLTRRLAHENSDLLMTVLPDWLNGIVTAQPQDEALATFTPLVSKEMGRIDWSEQAEMIERRVRAYNPWPVTFTGSPGGDLRIFRASIAQSSDEAAEAGTVLRVDSVGIRVRTADGDLIIEEIQGPGGRRMAAGEYARGKAHLVGARLGGG